MNRSNVRIKSNIYPIKKDKYSDFKFFHRVRGAKAIKALSMPSTSYYAGNELQRQQIKNSIPCIKLSKYREEVTYGIVKKGDEFVWEDRCDFTECPCPCTEYAKDKNTVEYILPEVVTLKRSEIEDNIVDIKQSLLDIDTNTQKPKLPNRIDKIVDKSVTELFVEKKVIHNNTLVENVGSIEITNTIDADIFKKKDDLRDNLGGFNSITQEEVITASVEKSFFIDAPPGTGKTYSLIEKIKYLINEENIDPQEILVLSFSRAAVKEIRERVFADNDEELIYVQDGIRTIDSFATLLLDTYKEELQLEEITGTYDERIVLSTSLMSKCLDLNEHIRYFIVDEIQDAIGIRGEFLLELLKNLNCGFTFFGDIYQSINDFQLKNGIQKDHPLTSRAFRQEVINKYNKDLITGEFGKNYRQCQELSVISNTFRTYLKSDEVDTCLNFIDHIVEDDKRCIGGIDNFINEDNTTTYCFLCRRNIEALKVSKYLRDIDIKHNLLIPQEKYLLPQWLGIALRDYRKSSINREQFMTLLNGDYDEEELEGFYDVLLRFMDSDKEIIKVDELLLRLNSEEYKFNILYSEEKDQVNVTVSTIHKAKGREFDVVVMNKTGVTKGIKGNDEESDSEELRILYVGMTRPKKGLCFHSTNIKMPRGKKGNRERIVSRKGNKYELREIEVKCSNDVDVESFVSEYIAKISKKSIQQLQEYIKNNVHNDDELVLKRYKENSGFTYLICHDSQVIGKVSKEFMTDLESILKKTYQGEDVNKYYPKSFTDVFVRDKASFINVDGVGDYKVWIGISMVGIARVDNY